MLPGLRHNRLFRFAYAGYTGGRILLGYRLLSARRKRMSEADYEERLRRHHVRSAERIHSAVLRLQGLMIKIGQTIGSRPDVFPEEYARVLSRLQDAVPPRRWREMKPYIERELGRPIEAVFAEFDEQPVAAASLAQVYHARLHDGREVAVKAVYPNIHRLVQTDLRILKTLIWLESRLNHYPLDPVYRELAENVPLETDMEHEGRAMEQIAATLEHRPDVIIPRVDWQHTSKRVLTMDYIHGIKITELAALDAAGVDRNAVFTLLVEAYFEQMFKHGHFQADPHPGNILALPGNRLAILDFGLTKKFGPQFQAAFRQTTRAMFEGDIPAMVEGMKAQGFKLKYEDDDAYIATGEFFRAMADPDTFKEKELLEAVNEAWNQALKKNPAVDMPGEMTLPMRVFGLLFGLGAVVGKDVQLGQNIIPEIALKYTREPAPHMGVAAAQA